MPVETTPRRHLRLGTFIAWSLILHAGAGLAWGVPALVRQHAEAALERERKALAEQAAKGAAKAREHRQERVLAATRHQVEEQLKAQFGKLAQALPEARREVLWQDIAAKLAPSAQSFAAALGNPDTAEQDLRNLEAQLQRELVENLDRRLDADAAQVQADAFLAQVETQVAPDLARWMQEQVRERVARQLREQAERLVREQREAAQRQREAGGRAVQEAQRRIAEADETARRDRQDPRRSQQRLGEVAQRLEQAAKELASAGTRTSDLGSAVQDRIATACSSVTAAQAAVARAREIPPPKDAKAPPPAEREPALAAVDAALAAARQAAQQAGEAIAKADDREAQARARLREAATTQVKAAAEQAFTAQFRSETVPRLTPKLAQTFKEQLQRSGLDDPRLVEAVAAKAGELLAARVPELAGAGAQVQQRFADLAPEPAPAPPQAQGGQDQAAKPIDLGLAAAKPRTELDRKLADGQAKLAADAAAKAGEVARDGRHDGETLRRAKGEGKGDAEGLDLRERVSRLADGMRNGRIVGLGADGFGSLRQGALARGLMAADDHRQTLDAYRTAADAIANRGKVQGEAWQRLGANGEAARAQRGEGLQPARAAGADNASAPSATSNAAPYQPAFKSLAFAAIPCLPNGFAIDGDAGKWKDIPAVELKPEYGGDRSRQLMQLGWRADGLYARFTVADPDRRISKASVQNFWQGDTVEVWIDCLNAKEKFRARHAGQQFWIWPQGSVDDPNLTGGESVVEKRGGWYVPQALRADQLQRAASQTAEGYILEFRIPAQRLVDADLAAGRIIGFNSYVSTKAGTDWYWSAGKAAGTYGQPDTWGDLLLSGSDATLGLAGSAPAGSPRVLVPGQPLALRVADSDMDLAPDRRDKVLVTLKPGHGGQQIAVLEETGPSTGIFEGSVSTVLALGDDQAGALAVYEGERVDAVYLDQARANGARNAEVRLSLRFGAAMVARVAPRP